MRRPRSPAGGKATLLLNPTVVAVRAREVGIEVAAGMFEFQALRRELSSSEPAPWEMIVWHEVAVTRAHGLAERGLVLSSWQRKQPGQSLLTDVVRIDAPVGLALRENRAAKIFCTSAMVPGTSGATRGIVVFRADETAIFCGASAPVVISFCVRAARATRLIFGSLVLSVPAAIARSTDSLAVWQTYAPGGCGNPWHPSRESGPPAARP